MSLYFNYIIAVPFFSPASTGYLTYALQVVADVADVTILFNSASGCVAQGWCEVPRIAQDD